jgi:hypothetical protein
MNIVKILVLASFVVCVPWVFLSASPDSMSMDDLSMIRGGASCYVNGISLCPDVKTAGGVNCTSLSCDKINGVWSCRTNPATAGPYYTYMPAASQYLYTQLTTDEPGWEGWFELFEIYCWQKAPCSECDEVAINNGTAVPCINGAFTDTATRIPYSVDKNSKRCNTGS